MPTTRYFRFSKVIEGITDEECAWLIKYMEHRHTGLDIAGEECQFYDQYYPEFGFQILDNDGSRNAWFYSESDGDISQVGETVQAFLRAHRPKECFHLTWAEYVDTLRPDQFDGGALFVTVDKIETFHAGEWALQQEAAFKR